MFLSAGGAEKITVSSKRLKSGRATRRPPTAARIQGAQAPNCEIPETLPSLSVASVSLWFRHPKLARIDVLTKPQNIAKNQKP